MGNYGEKWPLPSVSISSQIFFMNINVNILYCYLLDVGRQKTE
jgi:hypothetical protein